MSSSRPCPSRCGSFTKTLKLSEPIDVKTRIVIKQGSEASSQPDVWWDGGLKLHKVDFNTGIDWKEVDGELACTGRHNGYQLQGVVGNILIDKATVFKQPFKKVHLNFHVKDDAPDLFNLDVHAPIFGGDITGQVRLEFTSNLRLRAEFDGVADQSARVRPAQPGTKIADQRHGPGTITPDPGSAPTSTRSTAMAASIFRTAISTTCRCCWTCSSSSACAGRIARPSRSCTRSTASTASRVAVQQLDLTGSAVSLTGKGGFNIDGSDLNLNFYPAWGRVDQLFPTELRFIFPAINKNILTIEVRGEVDGNADHLKFNKKLVPIVTDPLKSILGK